MNHLKRIFAFDIFIAITCDIDDLKLTENRMLLQHGRLCCGQLPGK